MYFFLQMSIFLLIQIGSRPVNIKKNILKLCIRFTGYNINNNFRICPYPIWCVFIVWFVCIRKKFSRLTVKKRSLV